MERVVIKNQTINNIILFWFSFTGLFNGLFDIILFSTSQKVLIDFIFILLGYCFNYKTIRINFITIAIIIFYNIMTCVFLLYYFNNNHYGIEKLLRNVVLTLFSFFNYFSLFLLFKDKSLNKTSIFFIKLQIFIQFIFYIFYLLFNKTNGLLGRSVVQLYIFQDWGGRFQGTFSEPACLGFWLGCFILIVNILNFRNKNFITLLGIIILYTACKAKFALIAFPIAFILAFTPYYKEKYIPYINVFIITVVIYLIALFFIPITRDFFHLLSSFIDKEGSATYVTRFSFLFASIDNLPFYPLGAGIGTNYEYFQNIYSTFLPIINDSKLETYEILLYKIYPNSLGSKEFLSYLLSNFGLIGFWVYLFYVFKLLENNKKRINKILIFFIFVESIVSCNLFCSNAFFCIIFSIMALNTSTNRGYQNGQNIINWKGYSKTKNRWRNMLL